jgi:hypothetical protein
MELEWAKASEGWFSLDSVDVSDVNAYGVYVIWRGRRRVNPIVMYVGRGNIRREIELRRTDRLFCLANDLKVSWATVDRPLIDSAAAYLHRRLRPLWGSSVPFVFPQYVNHPLTD